MLEVGDPLSKEQAEVFLLLLLFLFSETGFCYVVQANLKLSMKPRLTSNWPVEGWHHQLADRVKERIQ
jgi:hypothetical protein